MKVRLDIFDIGIAVSSVLSFLITLAYFDDFIDGYNLMIFFPLVFLILYFLLLSRIRKTRYKFTFYGITIMEWIRFVLMPPVCSMAGDGAGFSYINPSHSSLVLATVLMIFELCVVSLFSFLLLRKSNVNHYNKVDFNKLYLRGNKVVYVLFILIVLGILILTYSDYQLIHFFYIPLSGSERIGDLTETSLVLARQIVVIGVFLLFLWTVSYSIKKYEKTKKQIYVVFSIIAALLNVSIIIGERRTSQVYTAIICVWILIKSFPLFRKRIITVIGTTAGIILALMSIYKFFLAFKYNSYSEAITSSSIDVQWFSRTLQSYFFGPENVAATIDFKFISGTDLSNMAYDLLRSTFGLSFLLKGDAVLTSELFNTYIYGRVTQTGHLLSSVGYGYLYLGLFAPLISIFNIFLCRKFEDKLYTSSSLEGAYVWGYLLVRFTTNLFVSTPPLISNATIMLGTAGLFFFIAALLTKSSKKIQTDTNN